MKINERTEVKLDLKTVISIVIITASFVTMYFSLQADIEEAKKLPPVVIDRIEYDINRSWQSSHVLKLEQEVKELKEMIKELDKELH